MTIWATGHGGRTQSEAHRILDQRRAPFNSPFKEVPRRPLARDIAEWIDGR